MRNTKGFRLMLFFGSFQISIWSVPLVFGAIRVNSQNEPASTKGEKNTLIFRSVLSEFALTLKLNAACTFMLLKAIHLILNAPTGMVHNYLIIHYIQIIKASFFYNTFLCSLNSRERCKNAETMSLISRESIT
jgi:hypothetical protein